MPDPHRDPHAAAAGLPSEELVLAAIERAALHRARSCAAVPTWAILEHLGLARRSADARQLRSRLALLEDGGLLERSHPHGVLSWELTPSGRRRLRRARSAGGLPELPESPQHRAWRNAHTTAAQEIERLRDALRVQLHEASLLLDADPAPRSDAWLAQAEALRRSCWRVASASHCLREWPEPHDALPDIDEGLDADDGELEPKERARRRALRAGRRNVLLWDAAGER